MRKFLALIFFAALLAGCQNDGGEKFAVSNVNAFAGGVFSVEIKSNPTTGYSWNVTNAQNLKYVKLVSSEFIMEKPDAKIVGAPGLQRFEFSVNKDAAGKTETLNFSYFRPWEGSAAAAEQKIYTVNIK